MKKVLIILSIGIGLASCKSDYDCICVADGQEVAVQSYENVTRSNAVSKCKAYQTTVRLAHPGAICATPY